MNLNSSVPFCINDVDKLKSSIIKSIDASNYNDAVIRVSQIKKAILKLKLNKSAGIIGLQSDHLVNACEDLHIHLAMLLTGCFCAGLCA